MVSFDAHSPIGVGFGISVDGDIVFSIVASFGLRGAFELQEDGFVGHDIDGASEA